MFLKIPQAKVQNTLSLKSRLRYPIKIAQYRLRLNWENSSVIIYIYIYIFVLYRFVTEIYIHNISYKITILQ